MPLPPHLPLLGGMNGELAPVGVCQRRASFYTLGCRLNQAESQLLHDRLREEGYTIVPFGEPADLGIINTCTVTREAETKCRRAVRQFVSRNPQAFTAVIGCYSQTGAKALAAIPGIDLILGNQDKLSVLDYVQAGKNASPLIVRDRIEGEDFTIRFAGEVPFDQRANLKIQDGCDFLCSFCIIPFARGRARSRDFANTLEEARAAGRRGIRELVLTGVNLGTYASGGQTLVDLVDALHALPELQRLRISSIEPTTVEPGLLDRMADPTHKLQPYLHLPLQSGSDRLLAAMRRRYDTATYAAFVEDAARRVPELCLGTDILVGAPGESDEDFQATCQFFERLPFAYTHVFPYSERPGTLAVKRLQQDPGLLVPVPERKRRCAVLRRLSARKQAAFMTRHLGQEREVLLENPREGWWPGLTTNYIRVLAPDPGWGDIRNRLARIRLERLSADFVEGRFLELVA